MAQLELMDLNVGKQGGLKSSCNSSPTITWLFLLRKLGKFQVKKILRKFREGSKDPQGP